MKCFQAPMFSRNSVDHRVWDLLYRSSEFQRKYAIFITVTQRGNENTLRYRISLRKLTKFHKSVDFKNTLISRYRHWINEMNPNFN